MSGPIATPFDVGEPLPEGVTVLEASAGTGKTYTIAALATRYVAEGLPLDRLLLVSFTRAATGELRDRVRERLQRAQRDLAAVRRGDREPGADRLLALLAEGGATEVDERLDQLGRALADFDAATITTTHGFCQEVLGGLGVVGDLDREFRFLNDARDLTAEVVDDLYVRGFAEHPPELTRGEAAEIAALAVGNPSAPIADVVADLRAARLRRRLAQRIREEVEARKRRAAILTFDDLLTRLKATLRAPGRDVVAARLRRRYRVVLIDEFQDTDPDQWDIVREAFGGPGGRLVLIGDPKQAVYAFRGADVYAYLAAARDAGVRSTLDVNWRSDQGLIDAHDALFGGLRLGHPQIAYRRVRAAPGHQDPRLGGAGAPLRLRVLRRDMPGMSTTPRGYATVGPARALVARDVAAEVVALLSGEAEVEERDADGRELERRPVRPEDLAVLVRWNREAHWVREALEAAEVPVVLNGAGSVFATESARDWLRMLEALERPSAPGRARSVALTPFVGWSTEEVADADADRWTALATQLHRWAGVLRGSGLATLAETVMGEQDVPARLLGRFDGERRLTDVRHVAELLHAAASDSELGTTALAAWLRRRIAGADEDAGVEERARRLESDAAAVQILTIHASKGLEFPIVLCPYLWDARGFRDAPSPVAYHDASHGDERRVDVAMQGREYLWHRDQQRIEERGEELRLAYVALTRARHGAIVWWSGTWTSRDSALGRMVFDRDEDGNVPPQGAAPPRDDDALRRFGELAALAPGCVAVEVARPPAAARWEPPAGETVELEAARLGRAIDARWRRTSYSALARDAPEARVGSEVEEEAGSDDVPALGPVGSGAGTGQDADFLPEVAGPVVPLDSMPAGARVGTLIHAVLERTDFTAGDLVANLRDRLDEALLHRPVAIGERGAVVAGLRAAIETPLGPLAAGRRLRDLARADRVAELTFELPLAGGDSPRGELSMTAIAALLAERLPADDPLAGYPARLADPALRQVLRGYLTGTIDVVARIDGRYAVLDYKTNRLAAPGQPLTAWHHRPAALAAEMQRSHYALQALLYCVALHRFLRWRLADYDPDRDLAGVLYLFLRGMTGADAPGAGVFAWRPPPGLVPALSDLLDGP